MVDVEVTPRDLRDRKRALGQRSTGDTHLEADLPILDEATHRRRQRRAVSNWHQPAGLVRSDRVAAAGHIGGHDRSPTSCRLNQRLRKPLAIGGQHDE